MALQPGGTGAREDERPLIGVHGELHALETPGAQQ